MGFLTDIGLRLGRRFGRGGLRVTAGDPGGIVPISGSTSSQALSSAAVWACCRLISTSVGALPAHIFTETPLGKVKAVAHPYYKLLTQSPNTEMTYAQWIQSTVLHLLLYGNAYTLPDFIGGELFGLYPLRPDRITVTLRPQDSTYVFRYYDDYGISHEYTPEEIIHFRVFSLDGIWGLAPLDYQRLMFDADGAALTYATSLYKNGARPSGVLEYPGVLKPDQVEKIRASWHSIHGEPGRVAVLEQGTKYTPISVPLQQLEFISTMQFNVMQIARIFGVPPHLIGASDKPTYASVEQQNLEFLQYTIQPIVTSLERTIQTALLEPPYFYRLNVDAFQRSDIHSRYQAYAIGRQWGFLSVNDIRELEDLNRIGPSGDLYLQPLNMVPAGTTGQVNNQQIQENQL